MLRGPVVVVRRKGGKEETYDPQKSTIFVPRQDASLAKVVGEAPRIAGTQLLLVSETVREVHDTRVNVKFRTRKYR